jgi:4-hydroxy-tetrahydrodipicolinate synthase
MANRRLFGVYTALVTPFTEDGSKIDWAAFEKHVEAQVVAGVAGVIPCGTTGETPTLTEAEQEEVVRRTWSMVGGRATVIAGTGTNSTAHTIQLSRRALAAGADAVMIVMPYYNKPSQQGMVRHVQAVAAAVDAPVVLYNIPGRSGVELSAQSTVRLLETCPNVVAVKDATGNVIYCQELLCQAHDRVTILSGDDALALPMISVGAKGVVSVTSNVYPRQVSQVVTEALEGRWDAARNHSMALYPLHRALFSEPSPQPVKAALALKGHMTPAVRPPLVEASEKCRARLTEAMRHYEAT